MTQGGYQMAAQVLTLAMAIVGGVITGFILRVPIWDNPTDEQLYDDEDFWKLGKASYIVCSKYNELLLEHGVFFCEGTVVRIIFCEHRMETTKLQK